MMKIRILNGITPSSPIRADLLGIEYVHEAMAEPLDPRFPEQGRDRGKSCPSCRRCPARSLTPSKTLIIGRFEPRGGRYRTAAVP